MTMLQVFKKNWLQVKIILQAYILKRVLYWIENENSERHFPPLDQSRSEQRIIPEELAFQQPKRLHQGVACVETNGVRFIPGLGQHLETCTRKPQVVDRNQAVTEPRWKVNSNTE